MRAGRSLVKVDGRPMLAGRGRSRRLGLLVAIASLFWALFCGSAASAYTDYAALAGDDAYLTSVLLSRSGFASGVAGAVVANGDDYMAATSSAVLAASYGGPVLLTPAGSLHQGVFEELVRLSPGLIFVVGTDSVVATEIADAFPELADTGRIVLLRGASGPQTAALVAVQVQARVGDCTGLVLVSSDPSAAPAGCAVAASALGAAKRWPLLFVPDEGELSGADAEVVELLSPQTVVKVRTGVQTGAVSEVVAIDGADRYEVGAKLVEYSVSAGLSYTHTAVVGGSDDISAWGLAVGAFLARNGGVAVMCAADDVPRATGSLLLGRAGEIERLDFCGPFNRAQIRVKAFLEMTDALPQGFGSVTITVGARGPLVSWLEQRLLDLSYVPGNMDGKFDWQTRQAIIAFQKYNGMKLDGIAGPAIWWSLLDASRPVPRVLGHGTWIEVEKKRQVLLLCADGKVVYTMAASTGNPSVGITTPSGVFHVMRENTKEWYRFHPLYLRSTGYLAIHGFKNVPTVAVSHGCIRISWTEMNVLHPLAPVGTTVYIY